MIVRSLNEIHNTKIDALRNMGDYSECSIFKQAERNFSNKRFQHITASCSIGKLYDEMRYRKISVLVSILTQPKQ